MICLKHNTGIEFFYQLFHCFVIVDRFMAAKVVLLMEENNPIEICFGLLNYCRFFHDVMKSESLHKVE